jgi:hypothetical protein
VGTLKVTDAEPAVTVTVAGTDATAELDDSETIAPPAGAAALRKAVP